MNRIRRTIIRLVGENLEAGKGKRRKRERTSRGLVALGRKGVFTNRLSAMARGQVVLWGERTKTEEKKTCDRRSKGAAEITGTRHPEGRRARHPNKEEKKTVEQDECTKMRHKINL